MLKDKVRVEIYEGDPFTGCCGPGIASKNAIEGLRKMLMERNETVKALRKEFKEKIEIERQIVSSRKRYDMYPQHVSKLLLSRTRVPFILINGLLVSEGTFPSLEDLKQLISRQLENPLWENPQK